MWGNGFGAHTHTHTLCLRESTGNSCAWEGGLSEVSSGCHFTLSSLSLLSSSSALSSSPVMRAAKRHASVKLAAEL